ncbi:MAG: hypothetical protein B0W54_14065 [Cellvibrio sp. 79]|nr:MAG: hypothetical protein B0W54_14065 [Cellvibrio sp. 79]
MNSPGQPLPRRDHCYALLWLVALIGCALFCMHQIRVAKPFHSNLLELLPRDERKPVIHDLSLTMASRFEDKLLVLVNAADRAQGLAQARDLQARLLASPYLVADDSGQALPSLLLHQYRPYSQQLLTPERRAWLQSHSPMALAEQRYRELFSPVALPYPFGFAEDPFNLGGYWMTGLAAHVELQEYQGFPLIERAQPWLLVTAKLTTSPFDVAVQQDVSTAIDHFRSAWPQAQILTSGMVFHAAEGTRMAKHEINTVGIGSGLGIIVLVLLVFRSAVPLLAVLLTMTSAYVLALTVSLLVFERIHLITLAFGSTLLGVAGDYVLHFLMGSQREGSGARARHELRYAMAIGALTGMGAYLLQSATPFPGLQQMAVFCAAGIAGAWLTVLALAPYYRMAPDSHRPSLVAAAMFYRLGEAVYRPFWARPKRVGAALTIVVLMAVFSLVRGGVNDAVTNLNTSPEALMASERQVQDILQQPSISRFLVVEADTPEQLLVRARLLESTLKQWNDEAKTSLRWLGLHQYLPAAAQQEQDRQLVAATLYGPEGALVLLCQKLGTPCKAPELSPQVLTPAVLDENISRFLPPLLHRDGRWYSLVTLGGNVSDAQLVELTRSLQGVTFVNQTADLSSLLGRYRLSVSEILGLTLVLLAVGLAFRYRQRGWRMLLPLAISMVLALGCAAVEGITLFHTMALLLVIGIGLDTAVVYTEVGFNAESWLASSLACMTSVLAFGLLSLSVVPVLHQFGIIILIGILSAWLLTPLFFCPRYHRPPGQ